MKTPKISIIVPVYNAERYLHRCIESILAQTFRDFELLLIDDGSKDNSGYICDEYAEKDERVKVWHKENGGVSSARNVGLDNVKGEWVTFVDSDDYISSNYFDSIETEKEDMIIMQSKHFNVDNIFKEQPLMTPQKYYGKLCVKEFLTKHLLYHIMFVPWGKMFKSASLKTIRFNTHQRLGEDVIFVHQYLSFCDSISVISRATYYYYDNEGQFDIKYKMPPKESLFHLKNIIEQYRKLQIESPQFEAFEFGLFLSLCKKELVGCSSIWFKDPFVKDLISSCRKALGFRKYIKYQLFTVAPFYDFYVKRNI